jgi:hypothetical protein
MWTVPDSPDVFANTSPVRIWLAPRGQDLLPRLAIEFHADRPAAPARIGDLVEGVRRQLKEEEDAAQYINVAAHRWARELMAEQTRLAREVASAAGDSLNRLARVSALLLQAYDATGNVALQQQLVRALLADATAA